MSEIKVNKISPRTNCGTTQLGDAGDTITVTGDLKSNSIKTASGSTLTIGQSGDTVTLASGASQTGFGRTGTVDWDTTKKTAAFTAVSGDGYFVDTTSAAITVTLPASPSAGDIVAIADYAGTAATNNITIARNSSKIEGATENGSINVNRESKTLVYVDATQGWVAVNDNADPLINPLFVTATGGTITTCGNFKIHTFTGPGTFTVSCAGNPVGSSTVDYMVIAGGGGGGGSRNPGGGAGGGGAGGWRASDGTASGCYSAGPSPLVGCVSALPVTAQGYPITVGGAGSGAASSGPTGSNGSNSSFSTITSAGGGRGGSPNAPSPDRNGGPGGSGGGSPWQNRSEPNRGLGNTPPVSPPQGNNGGLGSGSPHYSGGGGGGAGAVGADAVPNGAAGNGGSSVCSSIDGSPKSYAGGGGGGSSGPPAGGNGGGAGGGKGGGPASSPGSPDGNGFNASDANRGSGGGAGGRGGCSSGGNGAAGVVVIRYKFQ